MARVVDSGDFRTCCHEHITYSVIDLTSEMVMMLMAMVIAKPVVATAGVAVAGRR